MKDHSDKDTKDIFTNSAMVGRPRKYVTNADKQRAYRARKHQATPPQSKRSSMNTHALQLMSKTFNAVRLEAGHPLLANLGDVRVISVILHESEEPELGLRSLTSTDPDDIDYYPISCLEIKPVPDPSLDTKSQEMVDQKPVFDPYLDDSAGKDFVEPEQDEALLSASFNRLQSKRSIHS